MGVYRTALAVLVVLFGASCNAGPTEQEIDDSLEATLRSVAGDWGGTSAGPNAIRLDFRLQEGSDGQVTGSGTMKEADAPASVPITVAGTFRRPTLSLTFAGMVYEGRSVQGAASGDYTSVGGVLTTLRLTGTGYSGSVEILLQEK